MNVRKEGWEQRGGREMQARKQQNAGYTRPPCGIKSDTHQSGTDQSGNRSWVHATETQRFDTASIWRRIYTSASGALTMHQPRRRRAI